MVTGAKKQVPYRNWYQPRWWRDDKSYKEEVAKDAKIRSYDDKVLDDIRLKMSLRKGPLQGE